jgi:nucleoside-diphosphate-sugar epimerase
MHRVNVEGTERLCAIAESCGVRRLVLVSSAAVYAPGPMLGADETRPTEPDDAYGTSKLDSERAARRSLGERVTVLRPCSVYRTGPCPFVDTLASLVRGAELPLVGEGSNPIDLVHSDDLAQAIASATEGKGEGGVFNVAGGESASFRELGEAAAEALGVRARWVAASAPDPRFPSELWEAATVPRTLSIERARRELAYAPARRWRTEIVRALTAAPGPASSATG